MGALFLSALSQAALAVIGRLLSKELFEDLLIKLVGWGARRLAAKTEDKTDDEVVETIIARLQAGDHK